MVWSWRFGPCLDARFRLAADAAERDRVREWALGPLHDHLLAAGGGSIGEIAKLLAPFRPESCIAQAWSAAEVPRCWGAEA